MNKVIIIGYSGHAYVVCDIFQTNRIAIIGYCDISEKSFNPFELEYLGNEEECAVNANYRSIPFFIAIGDNKLREKIATSMVNHSVNLGINAIHANAVVSNSAKIGKGVMIAGNSTINPLAKIGDGVICNTGCIIEHECEIGAFAHIAPGAVLAGNVKVGKRSFIGANTVVKQGVTIGDDVTIGAGSVIIRDIPIGLTMVGNPGRIIDVKK